MAMYSGVHYPPNEFWFQQIPSFASDAITVVNESDGYRSDQIILFKYEGHWFAHNESVWRFGGGGDGGHYDEYLPDASDSNIRQYAEKLKVQNRRS